MSFSRYYKRSDVVQSPSLSAALQVPVRAASASGIVASRSIRVAPSHVIGNGTLAGLPGAG